MSSFVGVDQVVGLAAQYGGVAFPAHVDRDSFSVIASLGAIPAEAGFTAAEVTRDCDLASFTQLHPELGGLPIFRDSDSHYLETLAGDPGSCPCRSSPSRRCWTRCGGEIDADISIFW